MPFARAFAGWNRPLLHAAVEHARERYLRDGRLDLRNVVFAVPGARAGRRLLELLVSSADAAHAVLVPPRIVTAGALPEMLFEDNARVADAVVRNIAWVQALQSVGAHVLSPVLSDVPRADDWLGWSLLGEVLDALHIELAGHELDFKDVAQRGMALETFQDQPRWMALSAVQGEYVRKLEQLGFDDPQLRRARAIEMDRCRLDGDLLLIGLAEIQPVTRHLLDAVAKDTDVTALIHAPEEFADRFDAHGCIIATRWSEHPIALTDDQLDIVDRPIDQATAVLRAMARFESRFAPQDIVIAVPDERVIPHVQQQLSGADVPVRASAGTPLAQTRTLRLLATVADYLEHGRVRDFAALVRHPDLETALRANVRALSRGDYLSALDEYIGEHVPAHLPATWIADVRAVERAPLLTALRRAIDPFVANLRGPARALRSWSRPLLDLLVSVYGSEALDVRRERDRAVLEASAAVRDLFDTLEPIPNTALPSVDAAAAIRWVERQLARIAIPPAGDEPAVELLGWLEIPLDDTPVLVATGMNEGIVPESVNADQFLPNTLRKHLGLVDNDQRHARDVFALQRMLASRERVQLVSARRTAEGDPLAPSRLLLACEPAVLAARVRAFYRPDPAAPVLVARGAFSPTVLQSEFRIPRPRALEKPFTNLRVTQFRDYLACPYRFYLKHGLALDALDDTAVELDAARFGTLAHAVLEDFGKHPARDETDPREVRALIDALLDGVIVRRFGDDAGPAVRVQIEQLRMRLREFASWQANWAREGWRILAVESGLEGASLTVGDVTMGVRGRIDRVDVNPSRGEWMVFDYKTSDTPKSPESAHRKKGEWVDLQLPLYRHLADRLDCAVRARELGAAGPPSVAYLQLPKVGGAVRDATPKWTDADYDDAITAAQHVVRKVAANIFWPPKMPPPPFSEVFAPITQDGQLGAEVIDVVEHVEGIEEPRG